MVQKVKVDTAAAREQVIMLQRWTNGFDAKLKVHPEVQELMDSLLRVQGSLEKIRAGIRL